MAKFEKALAAFLAEPPPKEARYADAKTVLEGIGFVLRRSEGSHFQFVNPNGQRITLAVHGGKIEAAAVKDIARAVREWRGQ